MVTCMSALEAGRKMQYGLELGPWHFTCSPMPSAQTIHRMIREKIVISVALSFFSFIPRAIFQFNLQHGADFIIKMDKWILTSHYDSLINNSLNGKRLWWGMWKVEALFFSVKWKNCFLCRFSPVYAFKIPHVDGGEWKENWKTTPDLTFFKWRRLRGLALPFAFASYFHRAMIASENCSSVQTNFRSSKLLTQRVEQSKRTSGVLFDRFELFLRSDGSFSILLSRRMLSQNKLERRRWWLRQVLLRGLMRKLRKWFDSHRISRRFCENSEANVRCLSITHSWLLRGGLKAITQAPDGSAQIMLLMYAKRFSELIAGGYSKWESR